MLMDYTTLSNEQIFYIDIWHNILLIVQAHTKRGPINLNSKEGKQLRESTSQEGKQGLPNSEFYHGWQIDYNSNK
jgi:hypothetical protein